MKKLKRLGLLARAVLFTMAVHGALCIVLVYGFTWPKTAKRGAPEPLIAVAVFERDIAGYAARQRAKLRREEETARAAKRLDDLLRGQKAKQRELAEQETQRKAAEARQKRAEKRAAQKRAEQEKQRQLAEQRTAEEAERRRKAQQKREAQAKQKADAARRRAATDALSEMVERIAAKVERNWRRPQTSRAGLRVTIHVRVSRDGRVVAAKVTRGSGDPFFDQSAERAVQKASPLPFPRNPEYYEFINTFNFKFHPDAL